MATGATQIDGVVQRGFEPVREAFAANFERHGEVGAACCVYLHGRPVVDIWGGATAPGDAPPYTDTTLQMLASATKGALAVCALRLAERGELDLDAPVASYWPEFGAEGKRDIPVRWLLSHRAGLPELGEPLTLEQILAWAPAVEALEGQRPSWEPGTAHGYHPLTFGWLVGELLARITGRTCSAVIHDEVSGPLGLDLRLGLPESEMHRVAPLLLPPPPPAGADPDPLSALLADPASVAHRAFLVPQGLFGRVNDRALWAAPIPAANGMGTARALARMYAACLHEIDGVRLLHPDTVAAARATESHGPDRVVGYETRYGLGFQLSFPLRPAAGPGSFGHYGLGGTVGFAHPDLGLAFGYVVNQMLPGGRVDPRSAALVAAVRSCC